MFHRDGQGRARFGSEQHHGGEKEPGKVKGKEDIHEDSHAPHNDISEKHVTVTHPGKTKPHPTTGVHAFHAFHSGGGKYESHTHHADKTVEKRQHPNEEDMHSAMNEALPAAGGGQDQDMRDGENDWASELGGMAGGETPQSETV